MAKFKNKDLLILQDEELLFGDAQEASLKYDGSNLLINQLLQHTIDGPYATREWVDQTVAGLEWQDAVLSKVTDIPGVPGAGDRYIIPTGATGAWSGLDDSIAEYSTTWSYTTPSAGFASWVEDVGVYYVYDSSSWIKFGGVVSHSALLDLDVDDHTQYLLADGTRPAAYFTVTGTISASEMQVWQGAEDDEAILFRSTDVAHGITTVAETEVYGHLAKADADLGGVGLWGFSEGTIGSSLYSYYGDATGDTDKDTTALGAITIYALQADGTGVQDVGATDNILVLRPRRSGALSSSLIADGSGNLYVDGDYRAFGDTLSVLTSADKGMTINADGTITFTGSISAADILGADHGVLEGLADDDHTIYYHTDGRRPWTGTLTISAAGSSIEFLEDTADIGVFSNTDLMSLAPTAVTIDGDLYCNTLHSASASVIIGGVTMSDVGGDLVVDAIIISPSGSGGSAFATINYVDVGLTTKSGTGHLHDDRYYTEAEANTTFAPAASGVTGGDNHDHTAGAGAQIDHTGLSNKGTNTHSQIDDHIALAGEHIDWTDPTTTDDLMTTGYVSASTFYGEGSGITGIVVSGGNIDHGTLLNLLDDTHTQYLLADGTRELSGTLQATTVSAGTFEGVGFDHDLITNTHDLTSDIDHDLIANYIANEHIDWILASDNLTTSGYVSASTFYGVDHDTITNTHDLTTDIDHDSITNTHDLTTDIDHDTIANYVANEHIDWTGASDNLLTSENVSATAFYGDGSSLTGIIASAAGIDHGTLGDLDSDDHPQYLLVDGSRAMTADLDMDSSYQVVNLQAPANAGEALRQTVNITEADLEQLTDGSDTTLHDHDGISENSAARHTAGTDTALGTMAADIDMDNSFQVVNLQAPAGAGEALRQTANITEADLEQLTDGSDTVLHDHDGISENTGARHTAGTDTTLGTMTADIDMDSSFQIVGLQAPDASGQALRQTANITEADLEQLTDGSDTVLHDHDGISENTGARHAQSHDNTDHSTNYLANISEDTTPQLGGDLDLNGQCIDFGTVLAASGSYEGMKMTVTVDDVSTVFGSVLAQAADFHYDLADADTAAQSVGLVMALGYGSGTREVLIEGQICDTAWNWSAGLLYLSATAGDMTQTQPAGAGDQVVAVGWALSADTIYFKPSMVLVEIA